MVEGLDEIIGPIAIFFFVIITGTLLGVNGTVIFIIAAAAAFGSLIVEIKGKL